MIEKEPILNINTNDINEKLAMLFTAETTSLSIYRGWQKEKTYYLRHFKKISVFNFYTLNFTEWLKYKKLDFNTGYNRIEEFFFDFYGANNNIIDISFFTVDIPKLHSISNKDETYIIFCIQYPLLSFIKNNTFDDEFKFTLNKWNPFKKTLNLSLYKPLFTLQYLSYNKIKLTSPTSPDEFLIKYYKCQINHCDSIELTIMQFLTLLKCKDNLRYIRKNSIYDNFELIATVLNHYYFSYNVTTSFHHYPSYVMWNCDNDFSRNLFLPLTKKLTGMNNSMINLIQSDLLKLEDKYEEYPNEQTNTIEEETHIETHIDFTNPLLLFTGKWESNKYYNNHDVIQYIDPNKLFECTTPHKSDIFLTDWLIKDYWQQIEQTDKIKTIQRQEGIIKKAKLEESSKKNKKSRKVFIFNEKE